MSTFFVDPDAITPPTIRITGDLLHHLRDSLRLHPGDSLTLNDGCGTRYRVEVTHVTSQAIDSRIIDQHTEPARRDLTDRARTGVDQRRQDGLGHSEGHRTRSRYHRAHSQHTQRHQAQPGTPGTSTIQMGAHCAGRGTTVGTMDHSHHRRPGRPRRDLPTICLGASEGHARGTFQRPFACHHAVATRTVSIRLSCW